MWVIPTHECMLSCISRVCLFATPWTLARQAPLFREFSRQQYWSGLPCPPPGDLPNPGIKSTSLMSPALGVCFLFFVCLFVLPLVLPGKPYSYELVYFQARFAGKYGLLW